MSGHKKIAWESWNAKVDVVYTTEPMQETQDQDY
jgi:hypothetical protein